MIDFSISPELEDTRQRTTSFMEEFVYPNESKLVEDEGLPVDLESELQRRVKALGLWAPNLPREWGGMGIGYIGQALINEIVGRSVSRRASLVTPRRMPATRNCCSSRPQKHKRRNTSAHSPMAQCVLVLR